MRRQATTVYRVALARTGNTADAEDVMQDVFVSYARKTPVFHGPEHEKAWFIRCAVNRCNNLMKSARRRKNEALTQDIPHTDNIERDIRDAVLSLKPEWREIIFLHYYEGYACEEIASILKLSNSCVKKRLQRGRDRLREILGGTYDDD